MNLGFSFFFWKAANIYISLIGKPVPEVPKSRITRHQSATLQNNTQTQQKNSDPNPSNQQK